MSPPPHLSKPDTGQLIWQAVALGLALAFFFLAQPADWIVCPFRRLTGMPCALCGMTRALCAIGHGEIRRAVELHALSPAVFAMFAGGFLWSLLRLGGRAPEVPGLSQARLFHATLIVLTGYWAWRLS